MCRSFVLQATSPDGLVECVGGEGVSGDSGEGVSGEGVSGDGGEGVSGDSGEGVMREDISRAYCSLAEIYLTDSW